MRDVTLTCPQCTTPGRTVGDPDEKTNGRTGRYHCFACKTNGSFELVMTPDTPLARGGQVSPLRPAA